MSDLAQMQELAKLRKEVKRLQSQESGGTASGPAGGDLTGTYPNPTLAVVTVTQTVTNPSSIGILSTGQVVLASSGNAQVDLQATTPGSAQTGHSNVSGTAKADIVNAVTKVQLNGVTTLENGTAFPGSPATNQRFFRTDRGREYYYDGTRWLETFVRTIAFAPFSQFANAMTVSTGAVIRTPALDAVYGVYIENFYAAFVVYTNFSLTDNWTLDVRKTNSGAGDVLLGNLATWKTGRVAGGGPYQTDPLVPATQAYPNQTDIIRIYVNATKVGPNPSTLEINGLAVTYRGIG